MYIHTQFVNLLILFWDYQAVNIKEWKNKLGICVSIKEVQC